MSQDLMSKLMVARVERRIVEPTIRAALQTGKWKGFTAKFSPGNRPYDGYIHPSSHSTWPVRKLAYYLAHGDKMDGPEFSYEARMSMIQGHFWHELIQAILLQKGKLKIAEVPLVDEELRLKGHADGLMTNDDELLEIKSSSPNAARTLKDSDGLRENKLVYYAQAQDYLFMSGKKTMRYVILESLTPFVIHEYVVHADKPFQNKQVIKYREAVRLANEGIDKADFCCAIKSKTSRECPARMLCPNGTKDEVYV